MNAPLYTTHILRLAASLPFGGRLDDPMGSAERRSPVCGSSVAVDVNMDAAGRVSAAGLQVKACALGQASAALMHANLIGRTPLELADARDALAQWLAGERELPPEWPGIEALSAALPYRGRHAAILLPFETAAQAAAQAGAR